MNPITGYGGPEEYNCSSTLSLTSTLDGIGGKRHALADLPPRKETRYLLCRRLRGPQGRSGRVWRISCTPGLKPRSVQLVASRHTDCVLVTGCEV